MRKTLLIGLLVAGVLVLAVGGWLVAGARKLRFPRGRLLARPT